ncbi:HAD-superfamily hydrolase, subfamily IIB [Desulfocapsa sulfexigens DSM 10523]|uniref:HAD-superfamily hydrolase, subfamily IIB n=1 Tax=Desulfocapsa sulfexigens (strain DSM 10523 / SB164P1) TaxID=1167006 RepID=M1PBI5_DESSD|nr:HAD-IIB family hydrolase [Desulfocapsa sulfexigens]AGF77130.1 HAD-superfamily hydrolase, subfamily IIB [Desulfocapsa sulfexigens DSM 10523]
MRLLVCTDLDRTLLPNGFDPESPDARTWFHRLAALPGITLAYVTGRDQKLVREAINEYTLPMPDFVLGDVGSSIYVCKQHEWHPMSDWQAHIAQDWGGFTHSDIAAFLKGNPEIQLQEESKQNTYKVSYYAPIDTNHKTLLPKLQSQLQEHHIDASLIWSLDEPAGKGLLDILPARATKRHAIEFLMEKHGYGFDNTVFSGDSGNDLPVLISPIHSVLVHNASTDVKREGQRMAKAAGTEKALYLAHGGFKGMNGNYAAGILEGVAHYHPEIKTLLESD